MPAIYPTNEGKLYQVVDNELFVLYQWIDGKNINMGNPAGLETAIKGIAAFHRDSAGYVPPENCRVSTKLGKWPQYYLSLINRMQEWKQTAQSSAQQQLSQVYLENVDHSIMLGEKALKMLEQSCYNDWVVEVEQQKNLCHQDYGDGNAIVTSEGIYVIDLDGVTYDLPVRDLRKIINKRMASIGRWDKELLQSIINWYCQINPLPKAQLHVLYIDLIFPHGFHDTAKNPYRKNKPINAAKLSKAAKHEQAKEEILTPILFNNDIVMEGPR
ncbi:MAG: CotS family spore coat protein [Firmicutes bacterium]|nr:CotS family spore coat protein [Bacillota bacterium]